jgi:predicted dehydrogenase
MSNLSRRDFLNTTAALAGGAVLGGSHAQAKPGDQPTPGALGSNERIRLAVAGIRGRGNSHIGGFGGMPNVEIPCLIEPDKRLWESRAKHVEEKTGKRPTCVQDIRRALDDDSIDGLVIATPNHWHSLMTIWACQAGKDVFVEKPMSHNVHEGRVVVEAAKRYNRVVQHGTQRRGNGGWRKVMAAIHSGKLGKLKIARGFCYKAGGGRGTRGSIGYKPHVPPPAELDFNQWLGPCADIGFHENLVHYRWHWFWLTGNGDLGNQGVHQMDVARWGIKGATLPNSARSLGGRLGYQDQGETASSQVAVLDFGETTLIFEVRGLPSEPYRGVTVGNIFELEAGTFIEHQWYPEGSSEPAELDFEVEPEPKPGNDIRENFIAVMQSRKMDDLYCDAAEGHYSSACCHLANIPIRLLGNEVPYRPRTKEFDDQPAALDALVRMEEYLAANGVDLETSGYHLGRELPIDPKTESFINAPEANELLTRQYRKGFELPQI